MKSTEITQNKDSPPKISIEAIVEKWLAYIKRFTDRTQGHYSYVTNKFIESLPDDIKTLDQLNGRSIGEYIDGLLDRWTNRTANAHLTAIKSFYRWLSANYDVPNFAAKVKMLKEEPPQPRVLTWEEYHKVLTVCCERHADIIHFLAHTGLRQAEIIGLKWGNISQDLKWLVIIGKGRKRRAIPLNKTCVDILDKYKRGEDNSPVDFIKETRCCNSINKICSRLSKRAGIKLFGPHAIRHLFATELLRQGIPIQHVSKALGHASIKTTENIYYHFVPEFLSGITDVLDEGSQAVRKAGVK